MYYVWPNITTLQPTVSTFSPQPLLVRVRILLTQTVLSHTADLSFQASVTKYSPLVYSRPLFLNIATCLFQASVAKYSPLVYSRPLLLNIAHLLSMLAAHSTDIHLLNRNYLVLRLHIGL